MRSSWVWSISLGRWWNVRIRLHLFFFFFAVFVIYTANQAVPGVNQLGLICPIVLFLSVLLHEIGHVFAARKLGGVADEIVLSPLGGLNPVRVPYEPHSELVAIMAGTLVNAAICCVCALLLFTIPNLENNLGDLIADPITASYFGGQSGARGQINLASLLELTFWLNWSLILVNLIPALPFDGGRSLHAVLGFLWPELEPKQSLLTICRIGKIISVLLLFFACYYFDANVVSQDQPPAWLALALLSIYIFFCSRREEIQQAEADRDEESVFGYDFSQGYTSLERSLEEKVEPAKKSSSLFQFYYDWMEKRRAAHEQRMREQETEDENRVDEILSRLHEGGMQSLSPDDRALLDRVSKRYRSRQA